jgi:bacterioferritin-associated ferredoxin
MQPDDELCLCFHVRWRKVINYIRIHRIRLPSQVSECQSAGTGCGWCRAFIRKLVEKCEQDPPSPENMEAWLREHFPNLEKYSASRQTYIAQGKGVPPADGG